MNEQRSGPARRIATLQAENDRLQAELDARPTPIRYLGETKHMTPDEWVEFAKDAGWAGRNP